MQELNISRNRPGDKAICLVCIIVIIAAVILAHSPAEIAARGHNTDPFDQVRIRYEGYLKAIGPGKWHIGDITVLVDRNTAVIEKRGRAEVGAWVVVFGIRNEAGAIYGEIIQVERPAGRAGPIWQFSGQVTKQVGSWWVIGDMLVEVTSDTQIIGAPGPNWLVWVVAEQKITELRALAIEAIADSPDTVPVEFRGILQSVAPEGGIIDSRPFILAGNAVIIGEPAPGRVAEVRARLTPAGTLTVHFMRVIPPSAIASGAQTAGRPEINTALHENEMLAAAASGNVTVSPWKGPDLVANGLTNASHPVLAHTPDGAAHIVWESNGYLFHAMIRPNGEDWGAARRIWMGREPGLAVDATGQLHLIFRNLFFEGVEIYHSRYLNGAWTLPVNVSRTSGRSEHPALVADHHGQLRAVWMDDTPGYWIIYAALWSDGFWSNQPIANARGQFPALAAAGNGRLFVAWQERIPTPDNPSGNTNILLCEHGPNGWSLPINVSDQTGKDAEAVSLTTGTDGFAYLVWVEGGRDVRWTFGQGFYWPRPQTIVQTARMARGPQIASSAYRALYVAWDEEDMLRATYALGVPVAWQKPEVVTALVGTVKDVSLIKGRNGATLAWVQETEHSGASIHLAHHELSLPHRTWLPILILP